MLQNNTKIYYMLYQLTKMYYSVMKNFPKEYKYSLGNETVGLLWNCLDLAIEANAADNGNKKEKIVQLSAVYEKLKMRVRMSQEIELISVGQFTHIEDNYMLEIGRMIGGWRNWASKSGGGGFKSAFFEKNKLCQFSPTKIYTAVILIAGATKERRLML